MVLLPEGANLTLSELREIAARQQQQIEAQQQLLIAKVQRLKFLKQQEARHHQEAQTTENERLRFIQEKLETQEIKLRRLRTLNGQVEQQRTNNNQLSTELESVQLLIGEKEKELSSAIEKVGDLTLQLEELRQGNLNELQNDNISTSSTQELAKLKRELLYHAKLTEQQSVRISQQQKLLTQRQDEVSRADQRILELKQRLHRKQLHNQQLSKQLQMTIVIPKSNNQKQLRPSSCNIAAVEPVRRPQEQERSQDDFHANLTTVDFREFLPNKNDPKYQTLPYNTKFMVRNGMTDEPDATSHKVEAKPVIVPPDSIENENILSSKSIPSECTSPIVSANKSYMSSKLSHLSPRPYGTPYVVCHPSSAIPVSTASNCTTVVHPAITNVNFTVPVSVSSTNSPSSSSQPVSTSRSGPLIHSDIYKDDNCNTSNFSSTVDKSSNLRPSILPFTNNSTHSNSIPWVKSSPSKTDDKNKLHTEYASLATNSSNNNNNKPAVPPKPIKPLPPPRQIQADGSTDEKQDSVDIALAVLKNSGLETSGGYSGYRERLLYYQYFPRYGLKGSSSKIHHADKKPQLKQDDTQGNSLENSSVSCKEESAQKRTVIGQLPIQPKPLTIKKPMRVEPPRLRNSSIPVLSHKRSVDTSLQTHSLLGMQFGNNTAHKHPTVRKLEYTLHRPENNETVNADNDNTHSTNEINSSKETVNISSLASSTDKVDHGKQGDEERSTSFNKFEVQVETDEDNFGIGSIDSENNVRTEGDGDSGCETVPSNSSSYLCEGKSELENNLQENASGQESVALRRVKKGNLRTKDTAKSPRRVSFDPLALLLDASLEGEVELVKKTACEVPNPSAANDEGITALHNAICAGHLEIVTFLVELGCDVNTQDSDGWTPLHCAASCNNLPMVKYLVEHGACIFATTCSDQETAAEKCEEDEDGFDGCSEYLYSIQEKLGIMNGGVVYAVYDYESVRPDELSFKNSDEIVILKKGDEIEREWWWSSLNSQEGYVPRNLLGLYPRVNTRSNQ